MIRSMRIASIRPGITRVIRVDRGQYVCAVFADDQTILTKIVGKPWCISHDVDDVTLIADAARGLWHLTREASQ